MPPGDWLSRAQVNATPGSEVNAKDAEVLVVGLVGVRRRTAPVGAVVSTVHVAVPGVAALAAVSAAATASVCGPAETGLRRYGVEHGTGAAPRGYSRTRSPRST